MSYKQYLLQTQFWGLGLLSHPRGNIEREEGEKEEKRGVEGREDKRVRRAGEGEEEGALPVWQLREIKNNSPVFKDPLSDSCCAKHRLSLSYLILEILVMCSFYVTDDKLIPENCPLPQAV